MLYPRQYRTVRNENLEQPGAINEVKWAFHWAHKRINRCEALNLLAKTGRIYLIDQAQGGPATAGADRKAYKILESLLFKTSESDRSRLFDHIYKRIDKVEQDRMLED